MTTPATRPARTRLRVLRDIVAILLMIGGLAAVLEATYEFDPRLTLLLCGVLMMAGGVAAGADRGDGGA